MAYVYILYSRILDKHYIGSCLDIETRLQQHKDKTFSNGFTTRADDWELLFRIGELQYKQARAMEEHIKKMKNRKYIESLCMYSELVEKLIVRYR